MAEIVEAEAGEMEQVEARLVKQQEGGRHS